MISDDKLYYAEEYEQEEEEPRKVKESLPAFFCVCFQINYCNFQWFNVGESKYTSNLVHFVRATHSTLRDEGRSFKAL